MVGCWVGLLRADRVPACNDLQDVMNVCYAVVVDITLTDADGRVMQIQVVYINITIAIQVTGIVAMVALEMDVVFTRMDGSTYQLTIAVSADDAVVKRGI